MISTEGGANLMGEIGVRDLVLCQIFDKVYLYNPMIGTG